MIRDQITSFDSFTPVSSRTESFSPTGSDRVLFYAGEAIRTGSDPSTDSVTFDGVAMTRIDFVKPFPSMELSLWYLLNPNTTGDLVVNCTNTDAGDGQIRGTIFSYTGCKQVSPLEAQDTQQGGNGDTMVFAGTTVTPNCKGIVAMFGSGVSVSNADSWTNTHPRPMIFDYDFSTVSVDMRIQGNAVSGNAGVMCAFASNSSNNANFFPFFYV